MKRNLLIVSLLAFSAASLVSSETPVREIKNGRGQSFFVGRQAKGPRVKQTIKASDLDAGKIMYTETPIPLQELPSVDSTKNVQEPVVSASTDSVDTGWYSWAKSKFSSVKEDYNREVEANADEDAGQEHLAMNYETYEQNKEDIKAKCAEVWEYGTAKVKQTTELAKSQFVDSCEYGRANPGTTAAVATAGFAAGVTAKYLWDKASTGARMFGAIGLSFAGIALSNNAQAQTFAQENSAPVAIAAVAVAVGVLSRTAYSYVAAKTKKAKIAKIKKAEKAKIDKIKKAEKAKIDKIKKAERAKKAQDLLDQIAEKKECSSKKGADLPGAVKVIHADEKPIMVQLLRIS